MAIIYHKELKKHLIGSAKESFPSICILHGEELLYKTALEEILNAFIPKSNRNVNYESIEGSMENISEAIERANTFSLIPGKKIIVLSEAKFFYSKRDTAPVLEKAKLAYESDDYKTASKHIATLLGLLNLSYDEVKLEDKSRKLKTDENNGWIDKIIDYCLETGLPIPSDKENTSALEQAIEKGFPKGNHLVITADLVNKNHRLFKAISDKGIVVDCTVPKGERMADKKVQESVTNEKAQELLKKNKKFIGRDAYRALYEMTGFDLRTFTNNLEKLISYIGDREEITENDVVSVLDRTKKDPIYEFTNAIIERNTQEAVFYLGSLLSSGVIEHPLQLLSAMVNQIRKLLIAKDFTQSPYGKAWYKECDYDQFRNSVLPVMQEYDKAILKEVQSWEDVNFTSEHLGNNVSSKKNEKKRIKKKEGVPNDLIIAKNPGNPFPIYKIMKHSENFTRQNLIEAFEYLRDADAKLKSSPPGIHKLILEEAVLKICQKIEG